MAEVIYDLGMDPGYIDGETTQFVVTIKEGGVVLTPTNLFITIRDEETGAIVGGRDRSALTPLGTYITSGILTYNLLAAENTLLNTKLVKSTEIRRITFEYNWLSAARVGFFVGRWLINPTRKVIT